jgi:hypothetical protein
MMLLRQYIIHIDVYMIYIPKKYREAQLVLINGRANEHPTLIDLSLGNRRGRIPHPSPSNI